MSLKEITRDKHAEAESTAFMRAVFAGKMPLEIWGNWTYNRMIFYGAIESKCHALGYLKDMQGIDRAFWLYEDFKDISNRVTVDTRVLPTVAEYRQYLLDLSPDKILAHLYTWHMGDLYGGQMIKKLIDSPHRSLEFDRVDWLRSGLRTKLNDSLGDEAICAFDWAIRIMNEYTDVFDI